MKEEVWKKEEMAKKAGGKGRDRIGWGDTLKEEKGMVTVYMSLLFLIIMGFAFCVIEGVRSYELSCLEEDAVISAGRGILANYDRELYRQYNVFFLDPREKAFLARDARDTIRKRFQSSSFYAADCMTFEVEEKIHATDYGGKVLHQQIKELMKYEVLDAAANKLGEYIHLLQKVDYDSNRDKINDLQDKEEAAERDHEAGEKEPEGASQESEDKEGASSDGTEARKTDPDATSEGRRWKAMKRTITGIIRAGILNYVVDDPKTLSSAHLPEGGLPSRMNGRKGESSVSLPGISFSGLGYLLSYFARNEADSYEGEVPLDRMMDIVYAGRYFNRFGEKVNQEAVLQYEMEYLCIGRKSDLDNLKGVVRRIMLLRFACNFAFASADPGIGGEAGAMADILAGAVGMPQLASTLKTLMIGALSYGETLLDVHTLLAGGKVPLVKSSGSWNLSFFNAAEKLSEKSMAKQGSFNVDYENYLQILLVCQGKSSEMLFRMMDLMQINIRQKEDGFLMKDCLFSFELKGLVYGGKWFPVIPGFGLVSDRRMETEICRTFSY